MRRFDLLYWLLVALLPSAIVLGFTGSGEWLVAWLGALIVVGLLDRHTSRSPK